MYSLIVQERNTNHEPKSEIVMFVAKMTICWVVVWWLSMMFVRIGETAPVTSAEWFAAITLLVGVWVSGYLNLRLNAE